MKALLVSIAALVFAVGCRAQIPPNPTVYTCPATTGTVYTALNGPTGTTALNYKDTTPGVGTYCYIAQSVSGSAVSVPSNMAGPYTLTASQSVALSWSAPTSGPTPQGYVISRAPAISSTLGAPALNGTTQ